jgi:hypothetical protein
LRAPVTGSAQDRESQKKQAETVQNGLIRDAGA